MSELNLLAELVGRRNIKQAVQLRVTPGVEAHTHDYIKTGMTDPKFGLPIFNGQAIVAVEQVLAMPNIILAGVHCHIGSHIFAPASFIDAIEVMFKFLHKIKDRTDLRYVN